MLLMNLKRKHSEPQIPEINGINHNTNDNLHGKLSVDRPKSHASACFCALSIAKIVSLSLYIHRCHFLSNKSSIQTVSDKNLTK